MKQQRRRRLLASLGAVVTAGALAIGSGVAMADASPSTIDPDAKGSINITKYETPAAGTGAKATGAKIESPTWEGPVAGVKYEACLVDTDEVNLLTNEGWQAATKVTADWVTEGEATPKLVVNLDGEPVDCTPVTSTETTGADGEASFTNLDPGLYVVREVSAPANVQANPTPFLVTVPMTDPEDRDAWMYDIYVYPKDAALTEATKSVDDVTALAPGKEIKWTVKTTVPYVPNQSESGKAPVTALTVTDTLPDGVVVEDSTEPEVTVKLGDATLTLSENYTVAWNDSELTVDLESYLQTEGNGASIQGKTLTVTITAKISDKVNVNADSSKDLKNTATVNVNGDEMELKTNEVTSTYASASFTKIAHKKGEETDVPLKDAKFAVYATRAAAMDASATPLVTSVATDTSGVVTLQGLRASSVSKNDPSQPQGLYKDGECSLNPAYQVYWLVEKVAPSGYELLAAPIPVVLEKSGDNYVFKQATETAAGSGVLGLTKDSGDDATTCSLTLTNLDKVENVPHNAGFNLPLTGGTGTLLLIVVGAGLLLFVLVMARRRGSVE